MGVAPSDCWPSPLQEALLRAAVLDGESALTHWQSWSAAVDLEDLDPESYRILAPLCANLQSLGVDGALMTLLRGVRRQTWASNQVLMRRMERPLRALADAGIPLLLLKGSALLLGYYRDFSTRALADVDVLVPVERVRDAAELLRNMGWSPVFYNQRRAITDNYIVLEPSLGFRNGAGNDFDLHWHVLPEACFAAEDQAFWGAAETVDVHGISVRVLAPTDQLLHVIAHGIKYEGEARMRWAVDALTILRRPNTSIDWRRLIDTARRLRLVLPLRDGLAYLRDRVSAPVADAVIAELQSVPTTRADRIDYRIRTTEHDLSFLGVLKRLWLWHRRVSGEIGIGRLFATAPRFLQRYYEMDGVWRLPVHAVGRGLRRIWRVGFSRS